MTLETLHDLWLGVGFGIDLEKFRQETAWEFSLFKALVNGMAPSCFCCLSFQLQFFESQLRSIYNNSWDAWSWWYLAMDVHLRMGIYLPNMAILWNHSIRNPIKMNGFITILWVGLNYVSITANQTITRWCLPSKFITHIKYGYIWSGWWYIYPSEKYEVSCDYYSQYIWKNKKCSKPRTSDVL